MSKQAKNYENHLLSVILTSWKEEKTIGKAITSIVDKKYSGYAGDLELLTVIPDKPTLIAATEAVKALKFSRWINITDPLKGKAFALNLAFAKAKGKYLLLTDGDVYLGKSAVGYLMAAIKNNNVGGVTGRPVAVDSKSNLMGYYANLLADAAHHKRTVTMGKNVSGHSLAIVSKDPGFFVLSGYIMVIRQEQIKIPLDCLSEDAYISYVLHNQGLQLLYEPKATVLVKYATNIRDWYIQKVRSVGGYMQLWKYGVVTSATKVRNFWKELEYFWFPIRYSRNIREFFWSLLLYPIRLVLWLRIFYEHKILKKEYVGGWKRVESTKNIS